MGSEQYEVDVDVEIAGIRLEIEDTKRDMKWASRLAVVFMLALIVFWDVYLSRTEAFICGATIFILVGVKDHLYRIRLRQAHDQLVNLILWGQADDQNSRRIMRVVRAIEDPYRPEKKA